MTKKTKQLPKEVYYGIAFCAAKLPQDHREIAMAALEKSYSEAQTNPDFKATQCFEFDEDGAIEVGWEMRGGLPRCSTKFENHGDGNIPIEYRSEEWVCYAKVVTNYSRQAVNLKFPYGSPTETKGVLNTGGEK